MNALRIISIGFSILATVAVYETMIIVDSKDPWGYVVLGIVGIAGISLTLLPSIKNWKNKKRRK